METVSLKQTKPRKPTTEELERISRLDSNLINELAAWANKRLTCVHCKRCTLRCEVLEQPSLDIGLVEQGYKRIMALAQNDRPEAIVQLVYEHPEMYDALRRCCFCGHCTAPCQTHMLAADRMRDWRELFMEAGLMPPEDSKIVMVDNEWHIFSAYRAIYGVEYPEFTSLASAAEQGPGVADTLFLPGCSLVSYAPDLTKKVGEWLNKMGFNWALSDDCCGSPLMSAGLFDRAEALRQKIFDQVRAAGITRILTVCPGCGEEFEDLMGNEIDIVPLPELMLQVSDAAIAKGEEPGFSPAQEPETLTFFDSCHDRFDNRHGKAIRRLMRKYLPHSERIEMGHYGKGTLCCGAGGAVGAYNPDITQRRVWRVIDEALKTKAETLVTMCPTCTYTIAQACLNAEDGCGITNRHYLELLFDQEIDWPRVFYELESMWSGEYGPWLNDTFF